MKYFSNFPITVWDENSDNNYTTVTNILHNFSIKENIKNNEQVYFEYNMSDGDTPEIIADKIYGSPEYNWIVMMMNDVVNPFYDFVLNETNLENYVDDKYAGSALYVDSTNSNFVVGETVTCNSADTTVNAWDASYKRLVIPADYPEFSETSTVTSEGGASGTIARRDVYYKYSLHHTEISGVIKSAIVNINDPEDTTDYLAQYMVGGSESKFITNMTYEIGKNESKRKIKLLKSDYLGVVMEQFKGIFD